MFGSASDLAEIHGRHRLRDARRLRLVRTFLAALVAFLVTAPAFAAELRVVDGDTRAGFDRYGPDAGVGAGR